MSTYTLLLTGCTQCCYCRVSPCPEAVTIPKQSYPNQVSAAICKDVNIFIMASQYGYNMVLISFYIMVKPKSFHLYG